VARPTLSRALYTQMVGRGVRPFGMEEGLTLEQRKAYMAASEKPDCLILDFAGNSGKYSLMSPIDVLGSDRFTPEEIKQAKKEQEESEESEENPEDALNASRLELEKLAKLEKAKVKFYERNFEPFSVLHLKNPVDTSAFGRDPMTQKQYNALLKFGVAKEDVSGYSKKHAKRILDALFKRKSLNLASYKQLSFLQKHGHTNPNISFERASQAIGTIINTRGSWKKRAKLNGILGGSK
jgi:superfamily II DNA or RNA helicase